MDCGGRGSARRSPRGGGREPSSDELSVSITRTCRAGMPRLNSTTRKHASLMKQKPYLPPLSYTMRGQPPAGRRQQHEKHACTVTSHPQPAAGEENFHRLAETPKTCKKTVTSVDLATHKRVS